MPLTRCPGCLQELDVESQWLGELVRCDACQTEFTAIAAGELDKPRRPRSDDVEEPSRRRRPTYDDYDDEPRPRRRRPKKSSAGKVLLILGGAVFVIFLGCAGLIAFVVHAANQKAEFAASDWQTTTMPDGKTTALFPGKPDHTIEPGVSPTDSYDLVNDDYDVECSILVETYNKQSAPSLDDMALIWSSAFNKELDGSSVSMKPTTYQGFQTRDFTIEIAFDTLVGRIIHVPGPTKDTFYIVYAIGLNFDDVDRKKFLNSLTIAKTRKL